MGTGVNERVGSTPERRCFLDRLRVLLTTLVIFHHAAITYGAAGDWFYRERVPDGSPFSLALTLFCAVNQSYFMGMFFLIAGYFTPDALRRKGPHDYLRDRLLRLGVPLFVFGLVLGPLTVQLARGATFASLQLWFTTDAVGQFVMGPLWFCWALLIFSLVGVWLCYSRMGTGLAAMPNTASMLASAACVGLGAFTVRLLVPVGQSVMGLQLGYFVSYLFLFVIGCMAAPHKLLEKPAPAQVMPLAAVSLVTAPLLPAMILVGEQMDVPLASFGGGWNWAALAYAMWEPLVAWGIIACLLYWGRLRLNRPSKFWAHLSSNAYGAFVVHAPVLVLVSLGFSGTALPTPVKFLLVATLATLLSFGIAFVLRASALIRKVL